MLTAGGFAEWFLNLGIGLGILITTLLLVVGGFGVATSAGNPENLEKAKETITSALAGLAFILLSWLILDIIGTDILGINIFNR
uniref:Uncharacterized protein n=1 Tax=candidate division WWE3 bacterium TaxID=2053526 RepID=A0A831Z0R2_UNCKA